MCETKRLHAVKHRPELAGEEFTKLLVVCHGVLLLLLLDLWVIKVHHLGGGVVITSLPRQRVVFVFAVGGCFVLFCACLFHDRTHTELFFLRTSRTWQNSF